MTLGEFRKRTKEMVDSVEMIVDFEIDEPTFGFYLLSALERFERHDKAIFFQVRKIG
jgi:hypothetical protein